MATTFEHLIDNYRSALNDTASAVYKGKPGMAIGELRNKCGAARAELVDAYEDAQKRIAELESALAGMVHWFGKYPEFIPAHEAMWKVDAAIAKAKTVLGEPVNSGPADGRPIWAVNGAYVARLNANGALGGSNSIEGALMAANESSAHMGGPLFEWPSNVENTTFGDWLVEVPEWAKQYCPWATRAKLGVQSDWKGDVIALVCKCE